MNRKVQKFCASHLINLMHTCRTKVISLKKIYLIEPKLLNGM